MSKKIAIYAHCNMITKHVEDYVLYCLKGLQNVVDEILFVMNGEVDLESIQKIQKIGIDVLVRDNKDYDFGAWKAGIEYLGYDNLKLYEELLLTNGSFYGPIYPFSEMWTEMNKRECDFWGINRHPDINLYAIPNDRNTRYDEHIQSYWLVFRKKILISEDFKNFWNNLKNLDSFPKAMGYGEFKLTKYFEKLGYKSDTYMNFDKYSHLIERNPTFLTDKQVIEDRCPIIKRKYFCGLKDLILKYCNDTGPKNLLEFLNKEKIYDINLIWDDLLEKHNLSQLNDSLHLNFILPESVRKTTLMGKSKSAVIFYIYPIDLIEYCYQYAKNIPEDMDVFVVNTAMEVQKECKKYFSKLPNKVEFRLQKNRGRDNTALFITCKDLVEKYNYICFLHAKKSPYFNSEITSDDFRNHCFNSLLISKNYIYNIISAFDENPRLGILGPIQMNTGRICIIGKEWTKNYEESKKFLKKHLNIEKELDPHVVFPIGGMYWFRTEALKKLFAYQWKFEDFPEEPLPQSDGLLTHVLERVIGIFAQQEGYYTTWVLSDKYAENYLNNFYCKYRNSKSENFQLQEFHNKTLLDSSKYTQNKIQYYRYWILSKITFGKMRKHYKKKRKELKSKIKQVKQFLKGK